MRSVTEWMADRPPDRAGRWDGSDAPAVARASRHRSSVRAQGKSSSTWAHVTRRHDKPNKLQTDANDDKLAATAAYPLELPLQYPAAAACIFFLVAAFAVVLLMLAPRPRPLEPAERFFPDPLKPSSRKPFPQSLGERNPDDGDTVSLSVVVPAYCEESRLPAMLEETTAFLDARIAESPPDAPFSYEIIVVDDGSRDRTTQVALDIAQTHLSNLPEILVEYLESKPVRKTRSNSRTHASVATDALSARREIRIMRLEKNRGKGGAVTQGILASRGDLVMFADADGATRFADLDQLESELHAIERDGFGVAIGSRAHMVKTEAVVKRSFIRNLLMRVFHLLVYIFGVQSIRDTQCGFKLFSRKAAASIFSNMHVEGWIFDIEILIIASKLGIPIAEVSVTWHEVDGSKVSILRDSIQMLVQLIMIRIHYLLGLWAIHTPSHSSVAAETKSESTQDAPTSNRRSLRSRLSRSKI